MNTHRDHDAGASHRKLEAGKGWLVVAPSQKCRQQASAAAGGGQRCYAWRRTDATLIFVFLLALLGFHAVFANRDGGAPDLEPMNHEVAPAPTRSKGCKPGTFLDFNAGLF